MGIKVNSLKEWDFTSRKKPRKIEVRKEREKNEKSARRNENMR